MENDPFTRGEKFGMAGVLEWRWMILLDSPRSAFFLKQALPAHLFRIFGFRIAAAEDAKKVSVRQFGRVPFIPDIWPPLFRFEVNLEWRPISAVRMGKHDHRLADVSLRGAWIDAFDSSRNQPAIVQATNARDAIAKVADVVGDRPDRVGRNFRLTPGLAKIVRPLKEDAARQILPRHGGPIHYAQNRAIGQRTMRS